MLYLFNASVIEIDGRGAIPPQVLQCLAGRSLDEVLAMVADVARADPGLARANPRKAERVVQMLLLKAPQMHAALIRPSQGDQPAETRMLSPGSTSSTIFAPCRRTRP